jgi:hypothetical protein
MATDFNQVGQSPSPAQLGALLGAGLGSAAGLGGTAVGALGGGALGKLFEELVSGASVQRSFSGGLGSGGCCGPSAGRPDLGETLSSAYEAATEEDGISANESKAIAATADALGSAEGSSLSSDDVTDMLNEFMSEAQADGNFGQADLEAYKSLLSLVNGGGDGQAGSSGSVGVDYAGSGGGETSAGIPAGPEAGGAQGSTGMASYLFNLYSAQFAGGQQQTAEDEEGVSGGGA